MTLINLTKDVNIETNQTLAIGIMSDQKMEVYGYKHWLSVSAIQSRASVDAYLYASGTNTGAYSGPSLCCTKQMGHWLQTGLTSGGEQMNLNQIRGHLNLMGYQWEPTYTFMGSVKAVGNHGVIYGAKSNTCLNPIDIIGQRPSNAPSDALAGSLPMVQSQANYITILANDAWLQGDYAIRTSAGALVQQGRLNQNNTQISTVALANGLYLVSLKNNSETKTFKFTK
jgi:hypothetical protein